VGYSFATMRFCNGSISTIGLNAVDGLMDINVPHGVAIAGIRDFANYVPECGTMQITACDAASHQLES
jgi:hypothetical protein